MKTLIFSDTHLTKKFDQKKFNFLVKIVNRADKVIINGDFWDSWFTTFDSFIQSKWKNIFPFLLEKKTTYVYGNHDQKYKSGSRVKLFSVESTNKYVFKINEETFVIEHGDVILKSYRSRVLEKYDLVLKKTDGLFIGKVIRIILHGFEWLGFKVIGENLMTQSLISRKKNSQLVLSNRCSKNWLICGDTHMAGINYKYRFANTGFIGYGYASYLIIDNGKVSLHKEKYD